MTGIVLRASRIGPSARNHLLTGPWTGRVVSRFAGGASLLLGPPPDAALISLQSVAAAFHPWGIEMGDAPDVLVGEPLVSSGGSLRFDRGLEVAWKGALVPALGIATLGLEARRQAVGILASLAPEIAEPDLLSPLETWQLGGAPEPLIGLIGRGPGSSPLGDDLLVGLLAGLATGADLAPAQQAVHQTLARVAWTDRTTIGSAQMLAAALDGRFPEPLCRLVNHLSRPLGGGRSTGTSLLAEKAEKLLRLGTSSGIGLLHGLLAGLKASLSPS